MKIDCALIVKHIPAMPYPWIIHSVNLNEKVYEEEYGRLAMHLKRKFPNLMKRTKKIGHAWIRLCQAEERKTVCESEAPRSELEILYGPATNAKAK